MTQLKIKLDLPEMVYDIQNKTYLTGKSRSDGTNHEQVANMQANDDDENANQILRSISAAFAKLKMKLSEYLDIVDSAVSNTPISMETLMELTLNMPSNYNRSTATTLAEAAHEYVVSMAIADWFMITDKKDSEDYSARAGECLRVISEAASKRLRPVRPR